MIVALLRKCKKEWVNLEMNSEHIIKESSWNAQAESVLQHLDVDTSALISFEFVLSCFSVQHNEHATSTHAVPPIHQRSCDKEFVVGNSFSNES